MNLDEGRGVTIQQAPSGVLSVRRDFIGMQLKGTEAKLRMEKGGNGTVRIKGAKIRIG